MEQHSFKRDFLSGVIYNAIAKYAGLFVSLFVMMVLARRIEPAAFGVVSISSVLIYFVSNISVMGLAPAIVQFRDLEEVDIGRIYSLTLIMGISGFVFVILIAPMIASFYKLPALCGVIRLMSISVAFTLFNTVPSALALKVKAFKFIAYRTIVVQLIASIIGVSLALSGFGVYALAMMDVATTICLYFMTVRTFRVTPRTSRMLLPFKRIFSFAIYQILFNLTNLVYRNVDKLLFGYWWGSACLAYYDKSNHFINMPVDKLAQVVTPVLHPIFAERQHDRDFIFEKYLSATKLTGLLGFFIGGAIFLFAEEIVSILLGEKWVESVPYFRIFSTIVGVLVVQSFVGALFQATYNTRGLCLGGIISLGIVSVACTVGYFMGSPRAFSICIVVASFIIFIVYHGLALNGHEGALRRFSGAMVRPIGIWMIFVSASICLERLPMLEFRFLMAAKFVFASVIGGLMLPFVKKGYYELVSEDS